MDELLKTSMSMITNAGSARDLVKKSLCALQNGDDKTSQDCLNEAYENLKKAHIDQTKIIQNKMKKENEKSAALLFAHAQDTLMTINTEYNLAVQIVDIYKSLDKRIKDLEDKTL